MRADRLLSLVLLLRNRGRMTASELAAELEVSTRTVLRDVDALSLSGIPVYAERGRLGGYALLPGFSTDLTGLTTDEAVALLASPGRSTSDALGLGPAFSSAIRKVVAALPDASRARAEGAAGRVLVRRGGWLGDPLPVRRMDAVQRAVFAGRRVRLHYASRGSDGPRWRTVDPIGLVEAAGEWYLLGMDGGSDRTYRVSRILDVEELDEPAERPEGVDLEGLWLRRRADFLARLPSVAVTVRVSGEARTALSRRAATVSVTDTEEGTAVLELGFGDLLHAERVIWQYLPEAEVLSPPALRSALRARAEAALRCCAER